MAVDPIARGLAGGSIQQADAADIASSPKLTSWHRKIEEGIADTVVLISGDSTSAGDTRWGRTICDKIAERWPTHTVLYKPWVDASKSYPSGSFVTVQTGTGARTITVFNCSVSGQTVGYVLTNIATIAASGEPDVLIWNYGHNSPQDLDNYRAITHEALNACTARWSNMAVFITAQNPRANATTGVTLLADYAPDQLRQRANVEYANANGYGVIDANAAFRAYGDYNADLLSDGLHQNTAGNTLWTSLIWDAIKPKLVRVPTSAVASTATRVWVPAKAFDALDGSPSYAMTHGVGGWLLDASSEESISVVTDYPSDWKYISVVVYVACPLAPDAGNRAVVLQSSYQWIGGDNTGAVTSTTMGTWTAGPNGNVTVTLPTTLGVNNGAAMYTRHGGSRKPLAFRITRKAADAADTLAQDVIILGMMIIRMF